MVRVWNLVEHLLLFVGIRLFLFVEPENHFFSFFASKLCFYYVSTIHCCCSYATASRVSTANIVQGYLLALLKGKPPTKKARVLHKQPSVSKLAAYQANPQSGVKKSGEQTRHQASPRGAVDQPVVRHHRRFTVRDHIRDIIYWEQY